MLSNFPTMASSRLLLSSCHLSTAGSRRHPRTTTTTTRIPLLLLLGGGRPRRGDGRPAAPLRRELSSSSSSSSSSSNPTSSSTSSSSSGIGRVGSSSSSSSSSSRVGSSPPGSTRRGEYRGHNFPDFVERWDRTTFRAVGYALSATTTFLAVVPVAVHHYHRLDEMTTTTMMISAWPSFLPAVFVGGLTALYWKVGIENVTQREHAILRNYPVIGNIRYVLETIRPEVRQYLVESDTDGRPVDRLSRSLVYSRSKGCDDTLPFGTRRDVYAPGYEWACHSMYPRRAVPDEYDYDEYDHDRGGTRGRRATIGTAEFGTTRPYSASLLNVSAMSYGAISDNAILALSAGARMGRFYHNTGEGGVSASHKEGGGDLVWNVGTGYFGCGTTSSDGGRVFDEDLFRETLSESPTVRMIEIKLSQGAKPGHGGILPRSKITPEIASARKLPYPPLVDCHSPPGHSAFSDHVGLIEFAARLREASGGLPVGIKLCVGDPRDVAGLVRAMVEVGSGPDFVTVDGGEGGTGAAPPEYSDSVGLPLEEGLVVVRNLLTGAGIRDKVRIVASGGVTNGFSLVRTIALGADVACAARAFMLSLGCIQALKCNTNRCPTGIATQDRELQYGLDPEEKSHRVYNFHRKTMDAAAEIVGTIGHDRFSDVSASDIMRRITEGEVKTLEDYLPSVEPESLLRGCGPRNLQEIWDGTATGAKRSAIRWIY